MLNVKWRIPSRIVAILHLALTVIFFVLCVVIVVLMLNADSDSSTSEAINRTSVIGSNLDGFEQFVLRVLWFSAFVAIVIISFDLFTVILLLQATKTGADPVVAMKYATVWRNVNIIFIVSMAVTCFYFKSFNCVLLTEIVLRLVFVVVIWNYIYEIKDLPDECSLTRSESSTSQKYYSTDSF